MDQLGEEKWRKIIKEWRTSGLSALRYAKQHKISKDSFYKWAKHFGHTFKQRTALNQEPTLSFIELGAIEPAIALELALPLGTTVKATMSWPQMLALVQALRC